MPEVSIIVPIYKVESYIHRCVDSIIAQTFTDFELILVDDGSPDGSPEICDKYAKKDKRILVIHKANGGVSSARNIGMAIARGDYYLFCDGDDYVSPSWCETLLIQIKKTPRAFVYCNVKKITRYERIVFNSSWDTAVVERSTYYDSFKRGLSGYCWNKIYSSSIIKRNQLAFDEHKRVGEDVDFNLRYMFDCEECIYVHTELYFYYQREESVLHKYTPDWFAMHLSPFYNRIPFIEQENLAEYCDTWLYQFLTFFPLAFDKRNPAPWIQKFMYNQKMLSSKEFQFCLSHASGKNENPIVLKILKTRIYLLYWLFEKAVSIKQKMKKQNTQEESK